MSTQPEALRLADALDAEFVQGRISNSTGRESAVELRRLYEVNKTCESLARAVMADQTYHEKVIPKRAWVGLTDQEIGEVISGQFAERNYWVKITKALESKLKEKNA